jgi:FeS assembly SUF system protein
MTEEKAITKEPGEQNIKDDTLISADINTKEPDIGKTKNDGKKEHTPEEVKEEVIKVLKTCYDPEIPVDVWELGLIYDIKIATNGDVLVIMTLTSPSCPVAGILPGEIEQKIKDHPMVNDCKVQLTFDPPWSQKMMSEVAKLELGFL